MDLYCPTCGEPWDNDELHEIAAENETSYRVELANFRSTGCLTFGTRCGAPDESVDPVYGITRAQASSALFDMLGDDVDGVMSEMDDLFG